jgi:hypothetical protein
MSAFTTLKISRSKALQVWREHTKVVEPTNEELEEFLDDILGDRLYNAWVHDDSTFEVNGVMADDWRI